MPYSLSNACFPSSPIHGQHIRIYIVPKNRLLLMVMSELITNFIHILCGIPRINLDGCYLTSL